MDSDDYIPISALNQFDYCPHRCYLIHIENVFEGNEHTVAGSLDHGRADSGEVVRRGEIAQFRSVWLYSRRYRLCGKSDLIEEVGDGDSRTSLYPVEQKHGRRGAWKNDRLQLCAQALCLEEMLGASKPIERGYLFYVQTGRREEVSLDEELRGQTTETIERVHQLFTTRNRPPAIHTARCRGCSLYPVCLPRETQRLRHWKNDLL